MHTEKSLAKDSHTIGLLITHQADRQLLTDFLEKASYAVCACTSSDDCSKILEKVSLVIADESAARASSKGLRALKQRSGAVFLPLLVTLREKAESVSWLQAGFDDVLRMPLTKAELTARLRMFLCLREKSQEQYRAVFENSLIGIYRMTPEGHFLMANPTLVRMLGYSSFDDLARAANAEEERVGPEYSNSVLKQRVGSEGQVVGLESPWMRRDGTTLFVRENVKAVHDVDGETLYYDGVVEDITERNLAEKRLRHEAFHDTLTGLPNRAMLMAYVQRAIARSNRHEDYLFAVVFLDLDRFKDINDSLGHESGDRLLVATARMLEACVRPEDVVARLGGDEFIILLDDIHDFTDATRVADRIHEKLATPFSLDGQEMFTTASIGIALNSPLGYERPEDILRDADTAMYRAKALGKARHELFDQQMHTQVVARLKLETELRRAVERREFLIHYQPIVSLVSGRITGFEALVRWQHPERGTVYPAEFIPAAEETGLIVPIGRWVLQEACRQMRAWHAHFHCDPPLTISVNLSGKQFTQPDLVERISRSLRETGLDVGSLKLEITESVVMENAAAATATLHQLRDMGIKLHIDDFGTGYSSLSNLHYFPVETLKIDRSFINRMNDQEDNLEMVRMIVSLGHNLGMEVIAEGVETSNQLSQLKALECGYGQGYLFSRPVGEEAAGALLVM